jgi:hypothetical protein
MKCTEGMYVYREMLSVADEAASKTSEIWQIRDNRRAAFQALSVFWPVLRYIVCSY